EDGSIRVNNQGYDAVKEKYKQSIGKANFVRTEEEGALKVSFIGPFYSGYNVVMLDEDYRYALVFGENLDYMWILSREKTIPEDIKEQYLAYANRAGCALDKLVWAVEEEEKRGEVHLVLPRVRFVGKIGVEPMTVWLPANR